MKTKLCIILALSCVLYSCDKSKSAQSIYDKTPPIIYSMTPEEEAERMKDVFGCYGLVLDETNVKEANKILKSKGANFEKRDRSEYDIFDKGYSRITYDCPKVNEVVQYDSEIKHSSQKTTYINTIFVNDTLSQICIAFKDHSYNLEKDLVQKYGTGNGLNKETAFGRDKKGNINIKDCVLGYEYRQWQNEHIVIDWPRERIVYDSSKNYIKWNVLNNDSFNNQAIYTSKKMLPRIIHYFKKSYDTYIEQKNNREADRTNNI